MEGIDKNMFKQIFYDHRDAFKQFHPRFDDSGLQPMLLCEVAASLRSTRQSRKCSTAAIPTKWTLSNTDAANAEKYDVSPSPPIS